MHATTNKKMTHEQAVQQLQDTMNSIQPASTLDTSNVANIPSVAPTPMSELPLSQPIPPELDNIDAEEEGFYVDEKELQLAQSRVKRWLELDAEISTLGTALRERRREKDDLNKHLLAFMQSNQIPHFEMSKGNLSVAVSKHKQPLNQKFITEKVQAVEGLSETAKGALLKSIFEERSVTEKTRLKHVKAK